MDRQRALELFFLFCRWIVSYGVLIAFLAAPPVVTFNQQLAAFIQPIFPDLAVVSVIPPAQRVYATDEALKTVWLGASDGETFTLAERKHFHDVHGLFKWGSFVVGCAVILSILIEKEVIDDRFARDARRWAVLIGGLSILLVTVFPFSFELFHQLFFPQGNYSFSENSLIIQCFPPLFWLLNFVLLQAGVVVLLWLQSRHARSVTI